MFLSAVLSFWRHPFTALESLVNKWWNTKSVLKNQTSLHLGWPEGWVNVLQNFIFGLKQPGPGVTAFQCLFVAGLGVCSNINHLINHWFLSHVYLLWIKGSAQTISYLKVCVYTGCIYSCGAPLTTNSNLQWNRDKDSYELYYMWTRLHWNSLIFH